MSFEIRNRDLLARIGKLETKSGTIHTPCLLPVVNPTIQTIKPKKMHQKFGCNALMTNAYIIKKRFQNETAENDVHRLLDFNGVIVTDSGAYQTLVYDNVEITPQEIVSHQEKINTDIGTILDVPTGWKTSKEEAQRTVNETLHRAKQFTTIKTRKDIIWIGPVQGGKHLDLIAESATQIRKLPFQIHALGSPTPVMEQYMFSTLVDMIMTAKLNLPPQRPLHLFGAGHPFMFALAIALGCDSFDSAAYAIYARRNKYMTTSGTSKLSELTYFPCSCPVCAKHNPKDITEMPKNQRQKLLAEHNLYVSFAELKRIKQAIIEGRLWEHLEMRSHSHPALLKALKQLKKYQNHLERQSPLKKRKGLFFFSPIGLSRPEIVRYNKRFKERYFPPENARTLVLLPQADRKPFHKSKKHKKILNALQQQLGEEFEKIHGCTYTAPFGVIPKELDEVYPLSQHETVTPVDTETIEYVAKKVSDYIKATNYEKIILVQESEVWKGRITASVKHTCESKRLTHMTVKAEKLENISSRKN